LLWSACAYDVQVATIKSNILQQDTLLRYENDTFEIVYNLYAENGMLSFSIYNKSNVPLYIDWKRCAMIQGTQKQDYWNGTIKLQTASTGRTYVSTYHSRWYNSYARTHNFSVGTMTQEEQITFIPPKTAITMSKFKLSNIAEFKQDHPTEATVQKTYKTGNTKIYKSEYTAESSPLMFRNFLTLSLKHDFSDEFYVDHTFWVSQITKMEKKQFEGGLISIYNGNNYEGEDFQYPYRKPNNFYISVITIE
jgi:hypothetical protein